ncbi:MAG: S41 family peptidase [Culturomica sp.]|jgi:carboxyl-terminal processing protease|nr:S41 family peptidase [Culturomica sp.]
MKRIITTLIIILAVFVGMYINSLIVKIKLARNTADTSFFLPVQGSKLDMVINMLNYSYVDTVDINKIEDDAIEQLIKNLDPHTTYIPAKELNKINEGMLGNFGGIGIQFYKYLDTVNVIRVIEGGPSEEEGILAGDKIISVNDTTIAGVKMQDTKIMSMMRGEMGTTVTLKILRENKLITKRIERGNIPVKSVDVAYMINDTTGYIKVNTFGMHTYDEFMLAMNNLKGEGMQKVIVDLRNNEGGILPIALKMVNEFLPSNRLILYTQGKASPRADYYSNGKGMYSDIKLIILINEDSASASEIFAGAIQDNDRGLIVGRRSFGKGLVQEQRMLPDGSALRLTVARYYIPSGRSIQRPYNEGKEKYYSDYYERVMHGELSEKDSIHFDENQKFVTLGGRTVYGGGGIMPDVFVPADTVGYSDYLMNLSRSMQLYNYTFYFMEHHRKDMQNLRNYKDVVNYLNQYDIVSEMVNYAEQHGVKLDPKGLKESYAVIKTQLQAYIARHILDDPAFYPIIADIDGTLQKAISE